MQISALKFNRMKVNQKVLDEYFQQVENPGKNPAYVYKSIPGAVFIQYVEKGEIFLAIVSSADYEKIKELSWTGTNSYVSTNIEGKTIYLHRFLCPTVGENQFVHHLGSKFDNRSSMLEAVTPKDHDQHRTYIGDLIIDVRK